MTFTIKEAEVITKALSSKMTVGNEEMIDALMGKVNEMINKKEMEALRQEIRNEKVEVQ